MAEDTQPPKWVGKATAELKGPSGNQVWPLISDFGNLHKWFPSVETCYLVEGEPGKPGQIRYCASTTQPSIKGDDGGQNQAITQWAKERLLTIDPNDKCFSYEVLENNVGFKSYVGTIKVLEMESVEGDGGDQGGCRIEWSFVADPVEGWSVEGLRSYVETGAKAIAQRMEAALLPTSM